MPPLPFPYSAITHAHRLAVDRKIQLDRTQMEALKFRQVNVKEAFTLQGPDGQFYRASLVSAGPRGGEALVYEQMPVSPESPLDLTLVCAVLNRQRMLLVAQKATELGATRIQPVFTAHSVGPEGLEHEKAHAWPGAALRAVRQCRRATVPQLLPAVPLQEVLAAEFWTSAPVRFYLDDRAERSGRMVRGPEATCLAVGPEGGWSEEERDLLRSAGAEPLLLGGRILRAETAVLVGLSLVQHRMGDLKP